MKKQLSRRLSEILPHNRVQVCRSYDIIGDIAIIHLTEESRKYASKIGTAVMAVNKHVRSVMAQTSAVSGEFRLRKLRYIAGEKRTQTTHKEHKCSFNVDVAKCYFSPRLSHERKRIAEQVAEGETVVNMFAGVGCFSILIAKNAKVERVYSIDVNPLAIKYMRENVRINGVYGTVVPILGDAGQIIEKKLRGLADRVLMPLPEKAFEYLPYGLMALKKTGGWIHFYHFEHAKKGEDVVEKAKTKVRKRLEILDVAFDIPFGRKVRATGPNWQQVVLDIKAKPSSQ